MKTPILETERIILRPLYVSDAECIYKNWASDPDVAKYMIWELHHNVEDTKEWLKMEERNQDSDVVYTWGFVLKDTGELFGSGGVGYKDEYGMFEIGYNIMKKYWNRGLTSEASKVIIDFTLIQLGEKQILGRHAKGNIYSGKIMEKLGFVYQKDGTYSRLSGNEVFESKEYLLQVP